MSSLLRSGAAAAGIAALLCGTPAGGTTEAAASAPEAAVAAAAGATSAAGATAAPVASRIVAPHVTVELLAEHRAIEPGRPVQAGVRFLLEEGWHVYWKNPGDSGLAPKVVWRLPAGVRSGPIEWPAPERIAVGPLVDYGYSGDVLLPVVLETSPSLPRGAPARIGAGVEWLVCKEDCIPGEGELALELPVRDGAAPADPTSAALLAAARARLPREAAPGAIAVRADARSIALRLELSRPLRPGEVSFYPATPGIVDNAAPQELLGDAAGVAELVVRRSPQPHELPARLEGVVVVAGAATGGGAPLALEVDAPIAPAPAREPTPRAAASPARGAATAALASAIALAFAGGLLLNLMPCVFPVLSLKVLDFARQAGGDARRLRRHGAAYAAGIVASFWVLAGTLVALRAAGEEVGWGFQLQSPGFVAAMALLVFALALSLLGVFEIGVGLTGVAGRLAGGTGLAGSFATGVLATALATPCTAPFMGTALAAALAMPAVAGLAVFTALALGMAAPYAALCAAPGALSRLPRPGPWMESLKQWLAFPLLATCVWLVWVRAEQGPPAAVLALLSGMLLAAMGLWCLGRAQREAASRAGLRRGLAGVAVAAGLAAALLAPRPDAEAVARRGMDEAGPLRGAPGDVWQPYSDARLAALRAAGAPVFIDFTAAWCLTCQVNERLVLDSSAVRRGFAERGIALLRADWTNRDPAIARALEAFGRSGVPLYVLYDGGDAEPRVLPTILTPAVVLEAIAAVAPASARVASAPPPEP